MDMVLTQNPDYGKDFGKGGAKGGAISVQLASAKPHSLTERITYPTAVMKTMQ